MNCRINFICLHPKMRRHTFKLKNSIFYAKFCTFGKPLGSEQYFVRTRPEHRFNKKWSKLMYLIKTDKKSQFTEHISFISPLLKWVKKCLFSQCSVIKVHVKFQCKWLEMFLRNAEMCKKKCINYT